MGKSLPLKRQSAIRRLLKAACMLVVFAGFRISNAQNLVPNNSFETYTALPSTYGQVNFATPWYTIAGGTADYFHVNATGANVDIPVNWFGTQTARTGNAYVGIAWSQGNSYHEWVGVPLTSALVSGNTYYFEAYVSAGEGPYMYGINNFGAYFSTTVWNGVTGVTPQYNYTTPITNYSGWTQVGGVFTANNNSTQMALGCFFSSAATTWVNLGAGGTIASQYWYIEDVVVQPAVTLPLDLVQLNAAMENATDVRVTWAAENRQAVKKYVIHRTFDSGQTFEQVGEVAAQAGTGLLNYSFTDSPKASAQKVGYRIKEVQDDGMVHFSNITEVYVPFPGLDPSLSVSPNPVSQGNSVMFSFAAVPGQDAATIQLVDLSGRGIWTSEVELHEGMQQVELPVQNLAPGMYFVKVRMGFDEATEMVKVG